MILACIHGHLARSCEICAAMNDHAEACHQNELFRARIAELEHERDEAIDKAIRYDLDAAGIAQRESESRELIELRAEVGRLREALKKAWKGLQLAECQSFYQGGCEECEVCTAQFAVRAALAREEE